MPFFRLTRPLLIVAPVLLVLVSCRAGADPLSQTTVTPTAESSALASTPTPTASPVPSPLAIEDLRLLFLRHTTNTYEPSGELWLSDGDGSNERRLSPEGVAAAYAGKIRGKSGNVVVYFVTEDNEKARSVWRVDADFGVAEPIFSYAGQTGRLDAAVSPDGVHIAYVESSGLALLHIASGESRLLLASGDRDACFNGDVHECQFDLAPQWSRDGRLILVTHALYESGRVQVIDPFADPPSEFINFGTGLPSSGSWAPGTDTICAMGLYDRSSGLYLLGGPEWQPDNRLPEYEEVSQNPEGRSVVDCAWVSESDVAYLTFSHTPHGAEIGVLDVAANSQLNTIRFEDLDTCCSFGLLASVEGGRSVVAQFPEYAGANTASWARPRIVDIDTGESRFVLEADDLIVAAFTR